MRVNNSAEIQLIDCGEGVRLVGAYNQSPGIGKLQIKSSELKGTNSDISRDTTSTMAPAGNLPDTNRRGLVILLHGWEGSFESSYMLTAASALLNAGFDVFRLNLRDHGPSLHLNQALFNATLTAEITRGISAINKRYRPSVCFLAGYSLGGNFALRIAADSGLALNIKAAMAICPPLDPAITMSILERRWSPYQFYFFKKWRSSLRSKLTYFPELAYGKVLDRCHNLADINRFFIPGHTPFSTPEQYFGAYTLTGRRLNNLAIPALLLTSEDDPIIPARDLSTISASKMLEIELHHYGGHCGFIENGHLKSWLEQRVVSYFSSYHDD